MIHALTTYYATHPIPVPRGWIILALALASWGLIALAAWVLALVLAVMS